MQFEQPAELNRYVDSSIPLTWAVRWRALKFGLPLLACGSIMLAEQVAFRLWLNDRLSSELHLIAVCAVAPIFLIMLALELQLRIAHRTRRRLKLEAKQVSISPAKYNRVRFEKIIAWRLEPVAGRPEFKKLTLEYSLDKKRKVLREWSMVLRTEQERAFLSEMEQLRQVGSITAEVVRLTQPLVRKKANRRLRSTAAVAVGFYFLMHGIPLLGGGLLPASGESEQPRAKSQLTDREKAKFREVVLKHFASPEEFRRFIVFAGGSLTVLGAGLYFSGLSAIRKDGEGQISLTKGNEANEDVGKQSVECVKMLD